MKQPSSHMRSGDFTGNPESSAFELGSLGSDNIEPLSRAGGVGLSLGSNRYQRRRASGQSVKFTLPDKENNALKFKANSKKNLFNGLSADEDDEDDESVFQKFRHALEYRRMSAPELPPINSSGKNSVLLNDGFLATRSNTFHANKFNSDVTQYRKSICSDSSIQGYRLNSQSRTSSSSSKNSRTRVQSAGTDGRRQQLETTKENPTPAVKLVPPIMRNGISGMASSRDSVNGYRRSRSKANLINNNNNINNNNFTTPRKIKHVQSESHLYARDTELSSNKRTEPSLRRNISEKNFAETTRNLKNGQSAINGHRKVTANGNLNGMRRFSSTLGLSSEGERKSEEGMVNGKDNDYDSDTDSDKDQRVMDWIIGVNSVAEPPEEPDIEYVDEPPQRDTAIRIVYDGDS